jgi:hypothetical protein
MMSSHERLGEPDYQPDRPYNQLDNFTRGVAEAIAAPPRLHWAMDGAGAEELNAPTPRQHARMMMFLRPALFDTLLHFDFLQGLPTDVEQAWEEYDRRSRECYGRRDDPLPPDTPQ